jgi:hypothetical protein
LAGAGTAATGAAAAAGAVRETVVVRVTVVWVDVVRFAGATESAAPVAAGELDDEVSGVDAAEASGAAPTSGTTTVGVGKVTTGGAGSIGWDCMEGAGEAGASVLCAASGEAVNASAAAIAAVALRGVWFLGFIASEKLASARGGSTEPSLMLTFIR